MMMASTPSLNASSRLVRMAASVAGETVSRWSVWGRARPCAEATGRRRPAGNSDERG
jgi:hypothetical protein